MLSTAITSRRKQTFSMIIQGMPVSSDVFTRSQHSWMVTAAGTSVPTHLPLFIAATATGVCQSHGVAMITASMSFLSTRLRKSSSPSLKPLGRLPRSSSTMSWARSTRSGFTSQTAFTSQSSRCSASLISQVPRPPTPTKPRRTVSRCASDSAATSLPGHNDAPIAAPAPVLMNSLL